MNGDKPTWTLVAHVGIIGHDRVPVSLAEKGFSSTERASSLENQYKKGEEYEVY